MEVAVLEAHTMLALWWFQVRVGMDRPKKLCLAPQAGTFSQMVSRNGRTADGEMRAAVRVGLLAASHTRPARRQAIEE